MARVTAAGGRSVVALQAAPAKPADSAASSVGEPAAPAERPEPSATEEQEAAAVDDDAHSDSRPQIEHTWIFRYDSADAQRAGVTYVRSSPTGPPSTA